MDIVERLRNAGSGNQVWRVADPKTGAYCMEFDYINFGNPDHAAREWLSDHISKFPNSPHANKVVSKALFQTPNDRLMREAADEIERLRDALRGLDEAYCRAGTPLTKAERHEDRMRLIAARAALKTATATP